MNAVQRLLFTCPVRGLLAASAWLVCASALAAVPGFSDQTAAAGLDSTFTPLPDTPGVDMHGGGTVGDFNGDGWPDLFLLGGGAAPDRLYINNQAGGFVDRAGEWGLTEWHRGVGAMAFDYDGDGWQDLLVTSMGGIAGAPAPGGHKLFRNNGGTGFTQRAAEAGIASSGLSSDGYGPSVGDYDLDGDLDVFIPLYTSFDHTRKTLFRNEGNGSFSDVTQSSGARPLVSATERAFGAIFADMNGDFYPELLITADMEKSRYLINNRDGTFTQQNVFAPFKVINGMGAVVADFDRDGRLDWFITAIYPDTWTGVPENRPGNRLYMNQGAHVFSALPGSAGVNDGGWGWGAAALDFDHDGRIDIAMTNGWPFPDPINGDVYNNEPARLFYNQGSSLFTDLALSYGFDHRGDGRGLLRLDYDRDGDMDLLIIAHREPVRLFRNDIEGPGANWLQVTLDRGDNPRLAPGAWGSRVQVHAGGATQIVGLDGGSSYLGRSELIAHFGLGEAQRVDELQVQWADGFRTTLRNLAVNQRVRVIASRPAVALPQPAPVPIWPVPPRSLPPPATAP